ncbi:MAG: hypothetical protein OIF50_01930 [Flavobacteriaceae bacterium]|nr:hypothetical protein [Flavobacteriaceae bacterium]
MNKKNIPRGDFLSFGIFVQSAPIVIPFLVENHLFHLGVFQNKNGITTNVIRMKFKLRIRKKVIKEILWFLGTFLFVSLLYYWMFGTKVWAQQTSLDFRVRDSYFVLTASHVAMLFITFFYFCVYLLRLLRNSFQNQTVNILFLVSNILMLLVFTEIIAALYSLSVYSQNKGNTSTPVFDYIALAFRILQFICLILLVATSYAIGKRFRKEDRKVSSE